MFLLLSKDENLGNENDQKVIRKLINLFLYNF